MRTRIELPRRRLLMLGFVAVTGLFRVATAIGGSTGPSEPRLNAKSVDLQEMLEKGLRARRPTEFAFIGRVVDQVEAGTLPLDLVRGTFDWARRKRPYPYPYFERALQVRAARLGLTVE